ncbi:histidine kinase [Sphingomonas antarctica]|uniref:ATP-binding protein n=1 Tax=Sphingomonas antarctica TaxID=2040274 RepID=UPI0039E8DD17
MSDALLDAVADPLIVLDGTRVVLANTAARTMFGAHIANSDIRLTLRQPEAAALIAASADGLVEFSGPGGADQRLEMRISATIDGRRVVQIVDRSARHLADRLRTDFVANASHELRTPLAAIRGFIETLEDDHAGGDPAIRARFLKIMGDEAQRMERLIEELLSLSRIEADRFILPDAQIALADLIADVAAETVSQDGRSFAALNLAIESEPTVRGDRAQLSQLLHNLIDNARRYGDPGSAVTVRLWVAQDMAMLSVADQGPGITPQHLPRLTERFYRVDDARGRASGGTGLGLAIVKHIVDRHRGRLDIRSQSGVGTTVIVELPVIQ